MSSLIIYIIIVLVLAAVIVALSVYAYNRRLDRITRGEERDTHSAVPEPRTTVSVLYRTILMAVVIVSLLTVSALNGRISTLQSSLNELRSNQNSMNWDLESIRQQLEERDERVELFAWEMIDADMDARKAEVRFFVRLREYGEDTAVTLDLNGTSLPLTGDPGRELTGTATLDLFGCYDQSSLRITEGGRTYVKTEDMPGWLFWELLPMPSLECRFNGSSRPGKTAYDGEYRVVTDHTEDIQSVTVTYLSGGRELKTLDITAQTLAEEMTSLEKGLDIGSDLTFRLEIVTKSGFRIQKQIVMIYDAAYDPELVEYERITDASGNLLWENRKY